MYISSIETKVGLLHINANDSAVTYIGFFDDTRYPEKTQAANATSTQANAISRLAAKQLNEYFKGQRRHFDLPLAPKGTDFQQSIWQKLLDVQYGQTASYLDIAMAIDKPKACRAVGAANGKNPISIVIPCHRIVGSNGTLTGYAGGLSRKSFLLSLEQEINHK
jgi:methylated-DNA-[protein]-cysteine S-methyltransferase